MALSFWESLTLLAVAAEIVLATCVFRFVTRLEKRKSSPMGDQVGAHKAVLKKIRKQVPMSPDEKDYAAELISDARTPSAYAIPAALFTIGFFYVVGCLWQLQVHGGHPSFRTFIGGIPMFTSINMAVQLRKVAGLKERLQDAPLLESEQTDQLSTV